MNYSPELKDALLRRMLPPNNESITKISLNVKVVVRKSENFFYHSGCQILLRTWPECQWQAASLMRSIH